MKILNRHLPVLLSLAVVIFLTGSATLGADAEIQLCPYETKLLQHINQYRVRHALNPLRPDSTLQGLAKSHSLRMEGENYLSHDAFHERFERCGYSHCVENVGWNSPTPEDQLRAWKNSGGHNSNLLHKKIKFAGISKVGAFVTFFACD